MSCARKCLLLFIGCMFFSASLAAERSTNFWAFQPLHKSTPPQVRSTFFVRNPIDQFIAARLEQEGAVPSTEADRRTLIRRLSFDLLGLPPEPKQVEDFLHDARSDAYERLVDRFLESPHYGERWGRHWLDLVHFGETHGYDKDKLRPNAWPYRDYVIRAFNEDRPYSRFVQEQLAGDVLFPDDPQGIVATGFIAAGPWDFVGHAELPETKTDGLIARYNDRDDMVMTTMSTFMSLTVHCARCHDHKFDPITQKDYYRLQAVFAGVDRADRPYDRSIDTAHIRARLTNEKKRVEAQLNSLKKTIASAHPELEQIDREKAEIEKRLAQLAKTARESPSNGYHSAIASNPSDQKWVQVDLGDSVPLAEIRLVPARPTDFPDTPGFGFPIRFRVEASENEDFSQPRLLLEQAQTDFPNPGDGAFVIPAKGMRARTIRVTATRLWERTQDYVFALAELQAISNGENVAAAARVTALDSIESGRWAKKFLVDGYNSRTRIAPENAEKLISAQSSEMRARLQKLSEQRVEVFAKLVDSPTRSTLERLERERTEIDHELSKLPPAQLVFAAAHDFAPMGSFKPAPKPRPVFLLNRGDVKQPGPAVSPGAIGCMAPLPAEFEIADPNDEGARRAALARWITDSRNFLSRRSIVNRIWQHHFGRGLVDTPNDFGHMGSRPSHPELLDWLTIWFQDHGESMKALHRLILTSGTYRQSSHARPELDKIDSDNRWLGRMNRPRLEAEEIRDAILAVSGQLDRRMGGPSDRQFVFKDDHSPVYDYARFDVNSPASRRRSIYRFVVRSVPDPFMESLDCPDPSLLAPRRDATLTALQALDLLNDPFVLRQAECFANRLSSERHGLTEQIRWACQLAFSRDPRPEEVTTLSKFAEQFGLTNLGRVMFNSSEFIFVD